MTSLTEDRQGTLSPSLAIKTAVRVATTANLAALAGLLTVDGVVLLEGDRVLVKNQTAPVDNGIYDATTGAWSRSKDFDGNRDVSRGTIVLILEGTQASQWYQLTTANPIIIGSSAIAFALSLTSSSTLLSFIAAGAGAVQRSVQSKERDIIALADYGITPAASAAVNSAGLALLATAVNAAGGAIIVGVPGIYQINGRQDNGALCLFTNLTGLDMFLPGVVFADQVNNYAGALQGILFRLDGCSNVRAAGLKITTQNIGVSGTAGMQGFFLTAGCSDFDIAFEMVGGLAGLQMVRLFADPLTNRCSNFNVRANLTNVHYGVTGQFSGDNGKIQLNTSGGYRDFFFYGASHLDIDITCKNPLSTSLISTFLGLGCSDISLNYHDRESTTHIDLPRVQVNWGDQTPATHRDIRLHFDIANVAGSGGTPFFSFDKATNAGGPDNTGRGHQLLGFEISGNSDTIAGCNHVGVSDVSAMVLTGTPDVVKNIKVKDFICTGATVDDDWSFLAGALADTMVFDHVNVGARTLIVGNNANGRVIFKDCIAAAFNANKQGAMTFGPNGQAWELLDAKLAAGLGTIDLTLSGDYDEYAVHFVNVVPTTDDNSLFARVSEDGGGTYKAGATDYRYGVNITTDAGVNAPFGSAGTTQFQFSGGISGTVADGGLCGKCHIYNALSTGLKKHFKWEVDNYRSVGTVLQSSTGGGRFQLDNNQITNVRFFPSGGGTFAAGRFKLYGIRSSYP